MEYLGRSAKWFSLGSRCRIPIHASAPSSFSPLPLFTAFPIFFPRSRSMSLPGRDVRFLPYLFTDFTLLIDVARWRNVESEIDPERSRVWNFIFNTMRWMYLRLLTLKRFKIMRIPINCYKNYPCNVHQALYWSKSLYLFFSSLFV